MMMRNDEQQENIIRIIQINLGHRIAAHDALTSWLATNKYQWIACIQEPYFTNKGISRLPKGYGAFWTEEGAKNKRAAIIMPRSLNGYMVSQFSTVDRCVVRIDRLKLSIISLYCPGEKQIEDSIEGCVKENRMRKNVICCTDTNAHNERWGSDMDNRKWKGKSRGLELIEILDENALFICNEPPHPPTFVRDTAKHNTSHVDVTIASSNAVNKIIDWGVTNENFSSDHYSITFAYRYGKQDMEKQKEKVVIPWKKPGKCMQTKMVEVMVQCVNNAKLQWVSSIKCVDDMINDHCTFVKNILESIFKKDRSNKRGIRRESVYWWTEEVNQSYLEMRKARVRMRKYKYENLKEEFNDKRREFRRVVRINKFNAWKKFTSEITDPWDKLIRIIKSNTSGKIQARTLSDLEGKFADTMKDTLVLLSKQFFPTPDRKLDHHQWVENEVENALRDVKTGPCITICEFRKALSEMSSSTAPGEDLIINNVIKILAQDCKLEARFVNIYNICLKNFYFPSVWKRAKIVLIPKPSLNVNTVKSFRPIALTSCYGKLFERIILARLLHYLHMGGRMTENQHAYRKGASTQTALYEVFSVAQDALVKRGGGICVAVFLDISGAFDTTWHQGILHKLLLYGVPKYLVSWISCFLQDRKAFFTEGDEEHEVTLSQGCPQGGVLSPILWNVLFNEMLQIQVEEGENRASYMRVVGYADDAVIICKAMSTGEAARMINNQLAKICEWSVLNRVKFNPNKLAALTLSNKIERPISTPIYYNNQIVNEVDSYKYLGLTVDNKCNWNMHINNTVSKLALITKSLRGLACGKDGLSLDVFRILFHSIFIPVMTYGIVIWGWKAKSKTVSDRFDKEIRRFGLMASRRQKSTPSTLVFQMLKTKSFAQTLQYEVMKVSILQFSVIKTSRQSVYETYCKNRKLREVPQCMDQLYYMYRRGFHKEICDVEFDNVNNQFNIHPANWVVTKTIICDSEKAIVSGSDNRGWVLFTDASSSSYGVGWCCVAFRNGFCKNVDYGSLSRCSIFMAEAYAILQAVRFVNKIEGLGKKEIVEIRSDAQGLVRCLEKPVFTNRLLLRIKEELGSAIRSGKNIILRWVPGHKGIMGNEYADRGARKAVDSKALTQINVSKDDVKKLLLKREGEEEINTWNNFASRNVKLFLPDVHAVRKFLQSSPSTALRQVVSGHTRLNEFLCNKLGVRESPLCRCGKENETVYHFLFECTLHEKLRGELWEDFQICYDFITRDWKKLNEFVLRTGRFDTTIWEEREETSIVVEG